jgi:hypothetical protein
MKQHMFELCVFVQHSCDMHTELVLRDVQGHPDLIKAKLKQDLKPTIVKNWQIWVPFQFLNFRFVPQTLQVRLWLAPLLYLTGGCYSSPVFQV